LDTKAEAVTPAAPSVEARKNPREEQLTHILESTLSDDPESNEVLRIFIFECLNTYMFILTTIPNSIAIMFARIKPTTASSGR